MILSKRPAALTKCKKKISNRLSLLLPKLVLTDDIFFCSSSSYLLLGGCLVACVLSETLTFSRLESHKGMRTKYIIKLTTAILYLYFLDQFLDKSFSKLCIVVVLSSTFPLAKYWTAVCYPNGFIAVNEAAGWLSCLFVCFNFMEEDLGQTLLHFMSSLFHKRKNNELEFLVAN